MGAGEFQGRLESLRMLKRKGTGDRQPPFPIHRSELEPSGSKRSGGERGPGARQALPPVWRPNRRSRTQRKSQAPGAPLIAMAALGSQLRSTFQLSPKCTERGKTEPPERRARRSSPSSQRPPPERRPRPFSSPLLACRSSVPPSLPPGFRYLSASSAPFSSDLFNPWGLSLPAWEEGTPAFAASSRPRNPFSPPLLPYDVVGLPEAVPLRGGAALWLCTAGDRSHIRTPTRHLAGAPQTIKVGRLALEHAPEGGGCMLLVVEVVRRRDGVGAGRNWARVFFSIPISQRGPRVTPATAVKG